MRRSVLLLTLLVAGCRWFTTPPAPPGEGATRAPVAVEVIQDAAAVEALRARVAREEAKILDAYFAGFQGDTLSDYDFAERFRGRTEPRARLINLRDDGKVAPRDRARAAAMVCAIGDASCWDGFKALLAAPPDTALWALRRLGDRQWVPVPPPAILEQVVVHLQSASRDVRDAAVHVCREITVPGAAPHLFKILNGEVQGPRDEAARAIAVDAPSVAAVKHTASLVGGDENQNLSVMLTLGMFAASADAAVSKAAVAAMAAHAERPGASEADKALALDAMARFGSADTIQTLRLTADSAPELRDRMIAAGGLVRLGDTGAVDRARTLLAREDAAEGVPAFRAGAGTISDPALIKMLIDNMPKDHVEDQARVTWLTRGWTAERAAARLHELRVIPSAPTPSVVAAARREDGGSSNEGLWLLNDILVGSKAVLSFDTETGFVPVHHDLLLREMAGIARGAFAPSAVWEEFKDPKNDDESPYIVQFVHRDRLYRVTAENLGDWYDVPAVLAVANRALEDAGVKERFLPLYTGDQISRVLFADPAAAQAAAAEFLLVLEEDADRGRRDGRAFEAQVLEDLKKRR